MLTDIEFDQAEKIIEGLNIPQYFGCNGDDDEFYGEDLLEYQVGELGIGDFAINNGITKAVIIPNEFNFVVKIPFNCIKYYEWNEEDQEYTDDEYFEMFRYADAPDQTDYCWDELIKINKAYDAGFGDLFPATAFVKEEKNGTRCYIQEKVRTFSEVRFKGGAPVVSEKSRTTARSMDNYYCTCDVEWRAAVVEFYGEAFWKSFVDWDSINCIGILTDMHSNNYGYTMDGRPIILDVSGYREGD